MQGAFSREELERYERQLILEGIGAEGQERLRNARVFVAGVGGLGCPLLVQLASAGIGALRFVDDGLVERSNLNRQFLFAEGDIGKNKAETAASRLNEINPYAKLEPHSGMITDESAPGLAKWCDAVVDALDNMPARHALNRASLRLKIPLFHASVEGLEARVAVFVPSRTACLRCLYPSEQHCRKFPILGSTAALAASLQAMEVVKYLAQGRSSLEGKLLIFKGSSMKFDIARIEKNPRCADCGR